MLPAIPLHKGCTAVPVSQCQFNSSTASLHQHPSDWQQQIAQQLVLEQMALQDGTSYGVMSWGCTHVPPYPW